MLVPRLRSNRFITWLTCVVMVLAALAPVVSRSLAWASGGQWVELCSASGMKRVQISDGVVVATAGSTTDGSGAAALMIDHCPLCVVSADRLAPPSAPPSAPAFTLAATPAPACPGAEAAPCGSPAYPSAAPRGPPAQLFV